MKRIVLLVSTLVMLAAGCGLENGELAFMASPRGSHLEAVTYRITLQPSGNLRVRMGAEFLDDEGGILPIPKPLLGGVEDLRVNGQPAQGSSEFETVNVPVTGREAVATFTITGDEVGQDGNLDDNDQAFFCAVDTAANAYVAGYETIAGPLTQGWLRKYAP